MASTSNMIVLGGNSNDGSSQPSPWPAAGLRTFRRRVESPTGRSHSRHGSMEHGGEGESRNRSRDSRAPSARSTSSVGRANPAGEQERADWLNALERVEIQASRLERYSQDHTKNVGEFKEYCKAVNNQMDNFKGVHAELAAKVETLEGCLKVFHCLRRCVHG